MSDDKPNHPEHPQPTSRERLDKQLDALDRLLKESGVGADLAERGLNVSMVLTAIAGLRLYLEGDKLGAAEDFETVAEEIRAREAMRIGGHLES
ncbi:MAG: hypothetical protein IT379_27610 [Deltaproteobacteria bacterium]|nr:hypothetical protein [Deltaproteobacteria bacterium]